MRQRVRCRSRATCGWTDYQLSRPGGSAFFLSSGGPTLNSNLVLPQCIFGLALLAYLWRIYVVQECRDQFRSRLFLVENTLFDCAIEHTGSGRVLAYLYTRLTMHALVQMTDDIGLCYLLVSWLLYHCPRTRKAREESPFTAVVPAGPLGDAIRQARHETTQALTELLLGGLTGFLVRLLGRKAQAAVTRYVTGLLPAMFWDIGLTEEWLLAARPSVEAPLQSVENHDNG